jgi:hypothetical protein
LEGFDGSPISDGLETIKCSSEAHSALFALERVHCPSDDESLKDPQFREKRWTPLLDAERDLELALRTPEVTAQEIQEKALGLVAAFKNADKHGDLSKQRGLDSPGWRANKAIRALREKMVLVARSIKP